MKTKLAIRIKEKKISWCIPLLPEKRKIDIGIIVKLLRFLAERPGKSANVSEIVKGIHISYATAKYYIDFLVERGIVDVKVKGKEKTVTLTEKGYDLLLAVNRVYALLGFAL